MAMSPKPVSEEEIKKQNEKWEAEQKLRRTPWDALTADQKIERIREIIKNLQHSNYYWMDKAEKLERAFYDHQHLTDGKIIKIMNRNDGIGGLGSTTASLNAVENYF